METRWPANIAHAATSTILVGWLSNRSLACPNDSRGKALRMRWRLRPPSMSQRAQIIPTKLRQSVTLGTTNPLAIDSGEMNVMGTRNAVKSHRSSIALVTPRAQGLAKKRFPVWDVMDK